MLLPVTRIVSRLDIGILHSTLFECTVICKNMINDVSSKQPSKIVTSVFGSSPKTQGVEENLARHWSPTAVKSSPSGAFRQSGSPNV